MPIVTPLPKLQLSILLYLQLAEVFTSVFIFPFISQLILEYGITDDKTKVGYYAGAVSSLFFLGEMVCVYHWGRLSDKIGRRPVLMMGVLGLTFSSISFGLSKTLLALIISRALSGVFNGNVGVIKSMIAEITDETNQAKAFSFMPVVVGGAQGVANLMGGELSHPYERFPNVFGRITFLRDYPYALPCFVCAAYCISAVVVTFMLLKESLNTKIHHTTPVKNYGTSVPAGPNDPIERTSPRADSPLLPIETPQKPPPFREVLTPGVQVAILNYATMSLLNIVFLYLEPLFMSTPIELGGLGLEISTIGLILGTNGIVSGVFQTVSFAPLHRALGTKRLFVIAISSYFFVYMSWPIMGFLVRRSGRVDATTIVVLIFQLLVNMVAIMGFSCSNIFVTSAAPTRNTLGATTGLAQILVALMRAIGPATMGSLFAFSLARDGLGRQLVYVVLILVVLLSIWSATRLPKVIKRACDESAK